MLKTVYNQHGFVYTLKREPTKHCYDNNTKYRVLCFDYNWKNINNIYDYENIVTFAVPVSE